METIINTGTWEAWMEKKSGRLLLYVHGQVPDAHKHSDAHLKKTEPLNGNMKDLHLAVIPPVLIKEPYKFIEMTYNEEVRTEEQYKSVTITSGNQTLIHLDQIIKKEVL
jgi:hypothetical protein